MAQQYGYRAAFALQVCLRAFVGSRVAGSVRSIKCDHSLRARWLSCWMVLTMRHQMQASLNLVGVLMIQLTMPSRVGTATLIKDDRGRASVGTNKVARGSGGCCTIMREYWRALLTCGVFALLLSFLRSARCAANSHLACSGTPLPLPACATWLWTVLCHNHETRIVIY